MSRVLFSLVAFVCTTTLAITTTFAEERSSSDAKSTNSDLAAIREGSQKFSEAYNQGKAKAVAALWTPDGEFVDAAGRKWVGRSEIEKYYTSLLGANPDAKMTIVIDSLKLLSEDAAIEDGHAFLDPAPAGSPATGAYTVVHVKVDGKWLMSSVRDREVETPSTYSQLAALEWLVGDWEAEEHGATAHVTCRWIGNKSFLERKSKVTKADGSSATSLQIIGWNGRLGRIQSWMFSSDGSHAVGTFSPAGDEHGGVIEMVGTLADGSESIAVNVVKRLDENAFTWQSTERRAGGEPLPDLDEILFKRKLAK